MSPAFTADCLLKLLLQFTIYIKLQISQTLYMKLQIAVLVLHFMKWLVLLFRNELIDFILIQFIHWSKADVVKSGPHTPSHIFHLSKSNGAGEWEPDKGYWDFTLVAMILILKITLMTYCGYDYYFINFICNFHTILTEVYQQIFAEEYMR